MFQVYKKLAIHFSKKHLIFRKKMTQTVLK